MKLESIYKIGRDIFSDACDAHGEHYAAHSLSAKDAYEFATENIDQLYGEGEPVVFYAYEETFAGALPEVAPKAFVDGFQAAALAMREKLTKQGLLADTSRVLASQLGLELFGDLNGWSIETLETENISAVLFHLAGVAQKGGF